MSAPTTLTYSAFVRAIIFLSGRHRHMLASPDYDVGNDRKDRLIVEYIFRALATTKPVEEQPSTDLSCPGENTACSYRRDLLDVLYTAQPVYNVYSTRSQRRNHNRLEPTADRLVTPARPALSTLHVPTLPLLRLTDLLVACCRKYEDIDTKGRKICMRHSKRLNEAREQLQSTESISFENFTGAFISERSTNLLNEDLPIYDGIALLFSTFLHPGLLQFTPRRGCIRSPVLMENLRGRDPSAETCKRKELEGETSEAEDFEDSSSLDSKSINETK